MDNSRPYQGLTPKIFRIISLTLLIILFTMKQSTTSLTSSEIGNAVAILGLCIEVLQVTAPCICFFGNVILLHRFARASVGEWQICYLKSCFSYSVATNFFSKNCANSNKIMAYDKLSLPVTFLFPTSRCGDHCGGWLCLFRRGQKWCS